MRKRTRWLLLLALVLTAGYFGVRRLETFLVYSPSRRVITWKNIPAAAHREINFNSTDGVKLNGWFFPAAANSLRQHFAILVCHGNGGNLTYLERLTTRLLETGANVLIYDYRGYGRSEGRPGEEGTYRDAQAAYGWLRQAGFADTNIFAYGESLGGGMVSELVLREPVGGLILESTGTSIPDMGRHLYPWLPVRLINTIKYDTRAKLPRIKVPVLIMNSRTDGLVPFRMADENLAAANEPKLFFEIQGRHVSAGEEYHTALEKFLSAIETARARGREPTF